MTQQQSQDRASVQPTTSSEDTLKKLTAVAEHILPLLPPKTKVIADGGRIDLGTAVILTIQGDDVLVSGDGIDLNTWVPEGWNSSGVQGNQAKFTPPPAAPKQPEADLYPLATA